MKKSQAFYRALAAQFPMTLAFMFLVHNIKYQTYETWVDGWEPNV